MRSRVDRARAVGAKAKHVSILEVSPDELLIEGTGKLDSREADVLHTELHAANVALARESRG